MRNRDILGIGTSAGGVEALLRLARAFPADLPASVLVTIHLSPHHVSALDEMLSSAGPLPAHFAKEGERLRKQQIFVAPPDRHLLLVDGRLHLGTGPRENNSRPSIDAMLRSAAACCGGRTVGVVLTGTLGDGASGLWAVRQCGGLTVVQDPRDAAFSEMPQRALDKAHPDHVVPLDQMPCLLDSLVREPAGETREAPESVRYEIEMARKGGLTMEKMDQIARRSVFACPDCHGVMWEIEEGELIRYRCHVGHTYTAELMSLALDENLRRALGSSQRALEERVALARRLHQRALDSGHRLTAQDWASKLEEYKHEMDVVRSAILRIEALAAQDALREKGEAGGTPEELQATVSSP
jgi:two-component system, chemotaxis family, protein-glutamate methylesterase/glutaminase